MFPGAFVLLQGSVKEATPHPRHSRLAWEGECITSHFSGKLH